MQMIQCVLLDSTKIMYWQMTIDLIVIFWVVDICDMNVVGEKCVWLQNKERIDTHNNTVMML